MANVDLDTVIILTVAEILEVDPDNVTLKSSFRNDLGADPLDLVEVVMALERVFDTEIPDGEADRFNTIGDICDFLYRRFRTLPPKAIEVAFREGEIREKLKGKKTLRIRIYSAFSRYRRKFVKISAFSLFTLLTIYYLIIFAHWEEIFRGLALNGSVIFFYAFAFLLLAMIPLYGKVTAIQTQVISLGAAIVFSLAVLAWMVVSTFVGMSQFQREWLSFLRSGYVSKYHVFWIGLGSGLFYALLFRRIRHSGQISQFIDSFKAFPVISPLFCFGAPVFWSESLAILGIASQTIRTLGIISFMSGIAFLLGLVTFYVYFQREKGKESMPVDIAVPDSSRSKKHAYTFMSAQVSLFLLFLGLGLLTYVVLEIAYLAAIS
jgi:acyl carrier protein